MVVVVVVVSVVAAVVSDIDDGLVSSFSQEDTGLRHRLIHFYLHCLHNRVSVR